ncbi:MAG: TonB-dependent receptor plug domain-containing protein, partial [Proteobacteria bacterium]|nr:TonB-dependent receptor plug domain-containing protein [Pseudomonadota bacterium]
MKSKTFVYLLGAALNAFSPSAFSKNDIAEQSTIMVPANNFAQRSKDVIATHSIITSEQIERLQVIDVIDLLALQTGIDVARTGPTGSSSSIFIRGTNSDHVLVLVDGLNVSSTITGSFAWENLPTSQIERIEIIRGPRASIYGSDAIGGVIQIFTNNKDQLSL